LPLSSVDTAPCADPPSVTSAPEMGPFGPLTVPAIDRIPLPRLTVFVASGMPTQAVPEHASSVAWLDT
jgi:hypothetical protein